MSRTARGSRIIVRTATGKIAGTVAALWHPLGQQSWHLYYSNSMEASKDGKVSLSFELKDKHGYVRAPTSDEVKGAEVVFVTVSKNIQTK